MNKIWIYILLIVAFASCNEIEKGTYQLEATAAGIDDGKKIFIQESIPGATPIIIDTVEVLNEKFSINGKINEPKLYILNIEGERTPMYYIAEEGKINIELYKDSIPMSKIGGTTSNNDFYTYISNSSTLRERIKSLRSQQEIAKGKGDMVTMNTLNETYAEIIEEGKDYDLNFIKTNPTSFMSLLILDQMSSSNAKSHEEISTLYNGLSDEVKNTIIGKHLSERLAKINKLSIGSVAPDFTGPTPTGESISLKQSLGKLTILDFWAAWCKPCRIENPNIVALYNEYHDKGLNIVGVSLDRKAEDWKKAIEDDNLTWNHVSNLKFWQDPIAVTYNIRSIPATYLLDAEGKIIAKDLRGEALRAKVEELLSM